MGQICPACESDATSPDGNRPLSFEFRLILRLTLPLPDDDDISSIASSEEDDDMKYLRKQVISLRNHQAEHTARLEQRISTLESKVDGIETKLDLILTLLSDRLVPHTPSHPAVPQKIEPVDEFPPPSSEVQ